METSNIRKSEYLHTTSWEELYALGEHWQEDLKFYLDEIDFLDRLLDKYFILLAYEKNIQGMRTMMGNLDKTRNKITALSIRIKKHLDHLGLLMENAFAQNEQWFMDEQMQLEKDMTALLKEFRKEKREIFTVTGHVMESEKLKHVLESK